MSEHPERRCSDGVGDDQQCKRPARVALKTTRPNRDEIRTVLHHDERTAPRTATPYCLQHAMATLTVLSRVTSGGGDGPEQEWT